MFLGAGLLASSALLSACATSSRLSSTDRADPQSFLKRLCHSDIKQTTGNVWIRAESQAKEGSSGVSGQFPASVKATAPDQVILEVTNLLGGTEARIRVEGGKFTLLRPDASGKLKPQRTLSGSWGGIPLRWAPALFLGSHPCPDAPEKVRSVSFLSDELLEARVSDRETYRIGFTSWAGRPWVNRVEWNADTVFTFSDPDPSLSGLPRQIEAQSPRGHVKVRWRDREALR